MALIDVLKWSPANNDVFAFKAPEQNLSTFTQLIVHETQEAVFFSKGKMFAKFGPGKHTLDTENIPLLRDLFGIPFGGKNPFTAEVWFVNKTAPLNLAWTTDQMRYRDPAYNAMIPLRAEGSYGLQISDAERFLLKLVGTLSNFDSRNLGDQFRGDLVSKTKSTIIAKMSQDKIGINDISAYLSTISDYLKTAMVPFWEEQGFKLTAFYVTSIDVDDSTSEGKQIRESLVNRARRDIEGFTYQQEKVLGGIENGGGMGLGISMGMGLGAGVAGGIGAGFLNSVNAQPPQQGAPALVPVTTASATGAGLAIFCAKCGTKTGGGKFCPSCGKPYSPCPGCGADNLAEAVKCVMCSRPLGQFCPSCKAPVTIDAKFCPNCGTNFKRACPKCGTDVASGVKYCPNCGNGIS